jgi:hypothetical protein
MTDIAEEPVVFLPAYGQIPIAFSVERILDLRLIEGGVGGITFSERRLGHPYLKDHDAIDGNAPADWAAQVRDYCSSAYMAETQNINVAACRFYAKQGCTLSAINRFAYRDCPEEVQLIWRKELAKSADF